MARSGWFAIAVVAGLACTTPTAGRVDPSLIIDLRRSVSEGTVEVCAGERCVIEEVVVGDGVADVVVLSEPDLGIRFDDPPVRLLITVYEASGLAVRTGTSKTIRLYGECCGDWLSVEF